MHRLSLLLACVLVAPLMTAPPASANHQTTRAVARHTVANPRLAAEVWRAEVVVASTLDRYASGAQIASRLRRIERRGITTSGDLRALAEEVRAETATLRAARTVRSTDASMPALRRAEEVVSLLYPDLSTPLSTSSTALILESAAATAEDRSIDAWLRWARSAVMRGELRTTGVNPSAVPSVLEPGVPAVAGDTELGTGLTELAAIRARWSAHLTTQARRVARPDLAPEVAAQWRRTSPRRMTAVLAAVAVIGRRYEFAARGPDAFDCSGLTAYAWGQAGLALRTSAAAQSAQVDQARVVADLQPGDLLLRVDVPDSGPDHVAIVAAAVSGSVVVVHASNVAGAVRSVAVVDPRAWIIGKVRLAEERVDLPLPAVPVVWGS